MTIGLALAGLTMLTMISEFCPSSRLDRRRDFRPGLRLEGFREELGPDPNFGLRTPAWCYRRTPAQLSAGHHEQASEQNLNPRASLWQRRFSHSLSQKVASTATGIDAPRDGSKWVIIRV